MALVLKAFDRGLFKDLFTPIYFYSSEEKDLIIIIIVVITVIIIINSGEGQNNS